MSEIAHFHNGYMDKPFANCEWICADECVDAYTSYKFKKNVSLSETPTDAILYVYSPALFDVYINGELADDRRFAPAAAPAGKGYYETYDLTGKLLKGENTVGIFMGDGYNKISFSRYGWVYEGKKTVVAELHLRFAYHGFRYAEIEGIDEIPERNAFLAAFMNADLEETLDFECDDAELMTLYRNAERSMKGNSVSYPTDCTMRDERTPCIMDKVCYAKYGAFFRDTSAYVKEFLRNTVSTGNVNPGWHGAAVTLATKLYRAFGDKRLIEETYPTLLTLVKYCARQWEDGITDKMFGDWCAPNKDHVADYETGFSNVRESGAALGYLQVAEVLEMARLIGRSEDIPWLEERLAVIKASYDREFYDAEKGTYRGGTVASVLPLFFGMVDEKNRQAVLQATAERVKRKDILTRVYTR